MKQNNTQAQQIQKATTKSKQPTALQTKQLKKPAKTKLKLVKSKKTNSFANKAVKKASQS